MTVPAVLGPLPGVAVFRLAMWLTAVLAVAVVVVRQVWRAWRAPARTGAEGLIGRKWWCAPLALGQVVRVRAVEGLELVVEPLGGRTPSELMAALRARLR